MFFFQKQQKKMNKPLIFNETLKQLNSLIDSAEKEFRDNRDEFISGEKISSLGKYISIVGDLYHSLQLNHFYQLEELFLDPSFDELRQRWDKFLQQLDQNSSIQIDNPTFIPSTLRLFDIQNENFVELVDLYSNSRQTLFVFLRHLA